MSKSNDHELILVANTEQDDLPKDHIGCVEERHEIQQTQVHQVITEQPSPQFQANTKPISYIWLALMSTMCCCPLIGAVGVYFGVLSERHHYEGRHEEARNSSYVAAAFSIAAIVAGLGLVLAFVLSAIIIPTTSRSSSGTSYHPPYYYPH